MATSWQLEVRLAGNYPEGLLRLPGTGWQPDWLPLAAWLSGEAVAWLADAGYSVDTALGAWNSSTERSAAFMGYTRLLWSREILASYLITGSSDDSRSEFYIFVLYLDMDICFRHWSECRSSLQFTSVHQYPS